jgi:hypothetical protein
MRVERIPSLYLPMANSIVFSGNINKVNSVARNVVQPPQKNVCVYSGGFETYSGKSMEENFRTLKEAFRSFEEAEKAEWVVVPIKSISGETLELKFAKSLYLRWTNMIDTQI